MPKTYGLDRPMQQRYALQMIYPFVGDNEHQYRADETVPRAANFAPETTAAAHPPLPLVNQ
jgi:hypothetical protein